VAQECEMTSYNALCFHVMQCGVAVYGTASNFARIIAVIHELGRPGSNHIRRLVCREMAESVPRELPPHVATLVIS
jgi:hypothetical protein